MADQYGFNLLQTMKGVEDIKTARQNREVNQLAMDTSKAKVQRENMMSGLRSKAIGGDQDAVKQLMALDPEAATVFLEGVQKMGEPERERAKQNIEEIGRMSGAILQAKTLPEKQKLYAQMLQMLPEERRNAMPPQYNEQFMTLQAAKVRAMDKIMANPEVVNFGSEAIMMQGGREIDRTQRPTKELQAAGDQGPKTSDYNLVMRSIVPALGGTIDDQGNIRGIRDTTEFNAIAELAAQLLRTGQSASPIEAGTEALRRYGKTVKTPQQASDPSNPAAINQFFLQRN